MTIQKITPFLWYDGTAEEAANLYVSIFKNSRIGTVRRHGEAGPGSKGSVMAVEFQLEGQDFIALNGGAQLAFTPAISFFVNCDTQEEVDVLWEKLSADGQRDRCGWLKDKYGVSWQIIPTALGTLMGDPDRDRSNRVMRAMLQMSKIDTIGLNKAYEGQRAVANQPWSPYAICKRRSRAGSGYHCTPGYKLGIRNPR